MIQNQNTLIIIIPSTNYIKYIGIPGNPGIGSIGPKGDHVSFAYIYLFIMCACFLAIFYAFSISKS